MTRTIEQMIASEVLCCMSSLVAALANVYGEHSDIRNHTGGNAAKEHAHLIEQAFELACSIDDWEETAIQNSWTGPYKDASEETFFQCGADAFVRVATDWRDLCEQENLDPYQREVFEHWAVTDWFADKLEAAGEKVDKDFAGLAIWARTTTGQAIYADGVIERIYAETHKAEA